MFASCLLFVCTAPLVAQDTLEGQVQTVQLATTETKFPRNISLVSLMILSQLDRQGVYQVIISPRKENGFKCL
jgi:hypothetical protein